MCGIAGIIKFSNQKVSIDTIKTMTNSLSHRGPDGDGQWLNKQQNVGLGHRRLSIIDLSSNADQPMHFAESRYTITFNGEIYNYIELKSQLKGRGYSFKSDSDTEVLLALYHDQRESMLDLLDGMFALVIFDNERQTVFCARDRFGEKPFFYFNNQEEFIFASEMKAIWAAGVPKKISDEKRKNYIDRAVIRGVNSITETFYDNIKILDAGHYILFSSKSAEMKPIKYWSLEGIEIDHNISFNQAVNKFKELFLESIERRLRSDVSVGSSLSGGIDSSSIVKLIDQNFINNKQQQTFSARFNDFAKDEGYFIDQVTSSCPSIRSNNVFPEQNDILTLLQKASYHHEEPIGSASVLAQWDVYKKARSENVTVLVDGQGADEYLAGYIPIYNIYLEQLFYERRLKYVKEHTFFNEMHEDRFQKPIKEFDNTLKAKWSYFLRQLQGRPSVDTDEKYRTLKQHLELLTTKTTLKELLRYADRNSMAHSVEVRLPFLSHKLVEFVHSLPNDFLLRKGWTKYLLRKSMSGLIPDEICWRIDKVGYEPPQERWMENSDVKDILQDQMKKYSIIKSKNISYTNSSDWRLLADYFL